MTYFAWGLGTGNIEPLWTLQHGRFCLVSCDTANSVWILDARYLGVSENRGP